MIIQNPQKHQLNEIHALIRDSITLLCNADHKDDPANLDHWLSKRTVENLEEIIFKPESKGFVCVENGSIVGISHVTREGELTLCYVHPEYLGLGIGAKVLTMVESQARHWGLEGIKLVSTTTAKPFYERHGYSQYSDTILYLRMPGYPLSKSITHKS